MIVNGEVHDLPGVKTVSDLLQHFQLTDRPVAVDKNGIILQAEQFASTPISSSDVIELIEFTGGG